MTQQVEAEFSPKPCMKKTGPANVLSPGSSLVHGWMKTSEKSGCWPDFLGARALNHGFLYNWIGKLFLPSAWLGHSLIFYNFKTIHLKLIKFDENMVLWLVNQNFEKNQVLMYHFSSNACLRKLNLNLREKKSWFSNACNFLRKTFSNLLKHELYFN